jgi:hypothetical protein
VLATAQVGQEVLWVAQARVICGRVSWPLRMEGWELLL